MSGALLHGKRKLETWKKWRDEIMSKGVNLTPWEEDFVESVSELLDGDRMLTDAQAYHLEKIYAQRTP